MKVIRRFDNRNSPSDPVVEGHPTSADVPRPDFRPPRAGTPAEASRHTASLRIARRLSKEKTMIGALIGVGAKLLGGAGAADGAGSAAGGLASGIGGLANTLTGGLLGKVAQGIGSIFG